MKGSIHNDISRKIAKKVVTVQPFRDIFANFADAKRRVALIELMPWRGGLLLYRLLDYEKLRD